MLLVVGVSLFAGIYADCNESSNEFGHGENDAGLPRVTRVTQA